MSEGPKHSKPAKVPECVAKQAGETTESRWEWAEAAVWTERMLAALENGVKGGVWYALIDKVYAPKTLQAAFTRVRTNGGAAGVDHKTIEMYETDLEANLENLSQRLKAGDYEPQPIRRTWIPKPGSNEQRPLGIPTVGDRIVQTALRSVLEPIFEWGFAEHSYGFRPKRSCKDALRRVDALMKKGYTWAVDADLKGYFDSIPHPQLMARIKEKIADGRILKLIEAFLNQKVMEGMKEWQSESGTPQGAVISPLLSNIYLHPLDQKMSGLGYEMIRYADDFVVLCQSENEAREALERIKDWTTKNGLTLHPEKTRIVNAAKFGDGFDFLGYHFNCDHRWPSRKSQRKFKEKIRDKTRRKNGKSMQVIVKELNRIVKGWFEYFKHATGSPLERLDGWVRSRLRTIIRRRKKRYGMSRGRENREYPNKYFKELGLICMNDAKIQIVSPRRR